MCIEEFRSGLVGIVGHWCKCFGGRYDFDRVTSHVSNGIIVDCDEAAQLRILATDNPRRDDVDIDEAALLEILQSLSAHDLLDGSWWEAEDVAMLEWEDRAVSGNQAGSDSQKAANERLAKSIKVVVASEDVGIIHRALTARGGKLGQALTSICREYLDTVAQ